MIFQYDSEPVLVQRILIVFKAILENSWLFRAVFIKRIIGLVNPPLWSPILHLIVHYTWFGTNVMLFALHSRYLTYYKVTIEGGKVTKMDVEYKWILWQGRNFRQFRLLFFLHYLSVRLSSRRRKGWSKEKGP